MSWFRARASTAAADQTLDAPDGADGAAAWRARLEAGDATDAEWDAFDAWLARSPLNADAFSRLESLWNDIEPLNDSSFIRRELKAMRKERVGRKAAYWTSGLAAFALSAAAIFAVFAPSADTRVIRTGVGERRVLALSDGSTLTLNTASAVEASITASERLVRLIDGQAAFDVAKDPARPFVVLAGPAAIRATGTKFDVYRRETAVEVTLIEGSVDVIGALRAGARPDLLRPADAVLAPGDQILVAADGRVAPAAPVALETVTDWRDGDARFLRTPLAEAIEEMNRYSRERIILDDAAIADERISGVFKVGDRDRFIGALVALFPLRADQGPEGAVILSAIEPGR